MDFEQSVIKALDFRRSVQIGMMATLIALLSWHTTTESLYGLRLMAFLEAALLIYTAIILYLVIHAPYSHKLAAAIVVPMLSVILIAMSHPETPVNVFVWTFAFPVLSYSLLGRKLGFSVTLVCSLLALAAYISKNSNLTEGANPLIISDVVICMSVVWVITHLYERYRESTTQALHLMATTDELTGLQNRRQMHAAFTHLSSETDRQHRLLAVVVMDLDHFKKINDQWGHDAGDAVLVHTAKLLLTSRRKSDWVFRTGGEEFCLLLQVTDYSDAKKVTESIRTLIESTPCHYHEQIIKISSSIGFSIYPDDASDLDELLQRADQCMYVAKENGRNQVVGYREQAEMKNEAEAFHADL